MFEDIQSVEAETVWSLETECPDLWNYLIQKQPWVSDLLRSNFKDRFPIAPTLEPFDNGDCVRPPKHNRAFYIKHPNGAVLAVKGSEAVSDQLERAFSQNAGLGSRWSIVETFPSHEQKLPYAVHIPEAVQEAKGTVQFLLKYIDSFKELPPIPIHLAVYRISEAQEKQYFLKLNNFASARSRQQCRLLARDGIATYIYFFPELPIRVAHIVPSEMLTGGICDAASREIVLREKHGFDSKVSVSNFLSLVGRMLALGFFPLSMASYGIGYCTSAQNVTLTGGMVDSDSLTPFEQIRSDWEFATVFLTTLSTLCATVRVMLYSPLPFVRFEFSDPSTISMLLSEFVWGFIRHEISLCEQLGMTIDSRLQELLAPPSHKKLSALIEKMHPQRNDWFLARHLTDSHDNRGWD